MADDLVESSVLFVNDAVVFGILALILGFIFYTSSKKQGAWFRFYRYVPPVILCFFVPGMLNTLGVIDGENSGIYFVASRYLLPASLVLFTLSIDFGRVKALGPKAVIMFLTGGVSVVVGGPLTILIVSTFAPEWVGGASPVEVWRGLAFVAGDWVGGTVNGLAMYETFKVSDEIFPAIFAADVFIGYSWMAVLFVMAAHADVLDRKIGADTSRIDELIQVMESHRKENERIPETLDFMLMLALAFGAVGVAHFFGDAIAAFVSGNLPNLAKFGLTSSFLWVIIIATTIGIASSFTQARNLEHAGASKVGIVFLFTVATAVGMKLDLSTLWDYKHFVFVLSIWMCIHIVCLLVVAKLIKAPTFFIAVGSQANIGGPATASLVAAAFHPALMPVGIVLAIVGYGMGTYMAYFCGLLMQMVAPVPPY